MKVVLLAGGAGTRIAEETGYRPKPMIEIGGMPILWHIMKEYSHFGFNDFIVCAGYKQVMIKKWFADYFLYSSDITVDLQSGGNNITIHEQTTEPWRVTVVDTGLKTMTGGRLKRIQKYIGNETFMLTYGDGVCDVDLSELLRFHKSHGKIATLTSVTRDQSKGTLDIAFDNSVRSFREKHMKDSVTINAGYMVLEPEVFDLLEGDSTVLETDVLSVLADRSELMSYAHTGFWQCMDTLLEKQLLERLYDNGQAPWVRWE
ncbi:glucose-1-phosphate cytidylyltransferase [Lachnospiraceae bacterium KHCPX20]|nr:glucose-1-phosphate cytidylyltransferase [Lachnospiraceae bacterium KHCPX20]